MIRSSGRESPLILPQAGIQWRWQAAGSAPSRGRAEREWAIHADFGPSIEQTHERCCDEIGLAAAAAAFIVAIVISVAIIVAIRPWLQRIALAKPNARSSHSVPTPQGGGIAVIAATIIAAAGALSLSASAASAAALVVATRCRRDRHRCGRRRRRHASDRRCAALSSAGVQRGSCDLRFAE